jgi:hypothetical protein
MTAGDVGPKDGTPTAVVPFWKCRVVLALQEV